MTILFTGYPGFIGTALLPRVLARTPRDEAVCVVQDRYRTYAERQVAAMPADLARRVRLVAGDITRPSLGLSPRDLPLDDLTEIWHLAAAYDLGVAEALAHKVNVEGTLHVLDLADAAPNLRRLHHMSTCYVSGRYPGVFTEDDLVVAQTFNNHYESTKFLAEVAVRDRILGGLPATVYRPAIVVGDSKTGATQKYDGPYFLIRWLLRQPRVAVMPRVGDPRRIRFTMVPRDYLVEAVDTLSAMDTSVGQTYALADPDPPTIAGMFDVFAAATGKRVVEVPIPLRLTRTMIDRLGWLRKFADFPGEALDYLALPTTYDTAHVTRDLADTSLRVPPFEGYAPAMVDFTRHHGEVPARPMV